MNRNLWLFIMLFFSVSAFAQKASLRGVLIDFGTKAPIAGVKVSLKNKNISVTSSKDGVFIFKNLSSGADELLVVSADYQPYQQSILIGKDEKIDLGNIALIRVEKASQQEENIQLFDESVLDDDNETSSQSSSYLSGASDDIYLNAASYNYSPMRFSIRGYDQSASTTYINGINFNDQERGRFNYSSLGGLNDAFRNKDVINGIENAPFAFGSLGGTTNINTRATAFAAGTKASVAYSNRSYNMRATATHSTGLMNNGWAFTGSAVWRWSKEGIIEGTFYNSWGYFLSAEKMINDRHSISLATYGAPTKRSQSAAVTQEVYDFRGIYYNPYWGYQNGKKRSSRVVNSFDPTVVANWDFKITDKQNLKTGFGFHYSNYSNTALGFYNAADPRPDYYRNLPSYQINDVLGSYGLEDQQNHMDMIMGNVDQDLVDELTGQWVNNNTDVTQINWNSLYQSNYLNNVANPDGSAKYVLEERHNDLMTTALNSVYSNQINRRLKLTAGVEANYSRGMHYKTMNDLLGGNQWIDIDQFAERDFTGNMTIIQNDLRHPNRKIVEGDRFGYDYNMHIVKAGVFAQNEWNWTKFDLSYAARFTYTTFWREGKMENGRAAVIGVQSYGKGKSLSFYDPSFKAGLVYKINGRQRLVLNGLVETRAPYAGYAYVAPRVKDTQIQKVVVNPKNPKQYRLEDLPSEKIYSYDLTYQFTTPIVKGRITGFHTITRDGVEGTGYYNDEFRTYINHTLSGVNKRYMGVEAGISVKLNNSFSVELAGTYCDYSYTDDAMGTMSAENGANLLTGELPVNAEAAKKSDIRERVYIKDLKVNNGPQLAASITLDYFHPKMWFADITLSYFDNNYLDFSPSHFTEMNYYGGTYQDEAGQDIQYSGYRKKGTYTAEERKSGKYAQDKALVEMFGTQEKLKGGFMLDASVGKVLYLNNRKQSLNINLSFSNILNNKDMVTGGYQQGRIARNNKSQTKDIQLVDRYPNKYYYAWGFNCFLNLGYKF